MVKVTRLAVLANWGLGRELLASLHDLPGVEITLVLTRLTPLAGDPWSDCVAQYCRCRGISPLDDQTTSLDHLRELLEALRPDLMLTHAFMRRLPRAIHAAPPLGTINVHASLLPRYRGPAPAHWALINREPETGLTAHLMDDGLDTGPIVHQERLALRGDENLSTLIEGLKPLVRPLVAASLAKALSPDFCPQIQDERLASQAPRPRR